MNNTSSTTRRINASMNTTNGSSRWFTLNGGSQRTGTSTNWDPLTHNTSYTVRAFNSDGHNQVSASRSVRTSTLPAPAAAWCTASRGSQYAPTTVSFSGNGALSRTGANANSPGYYSATVTTSNSDGHNTRTSTNSCGVQVEQRPWISTGVPPGVDSPQCRGYTYLGEVVDLLNSARAGRIPEGYTLGGPITGPAADYGQYVGGSASENTLTCVFYRDHHILDQHTGEERGNDLRSARWGMGGGGAT